MGLCEGGLILCMEDEFGIAIADYEVRRVRTVNDFHELVLSKLGPTPVSLEGKAFYRTRKALAETLGIPPRSLKPSTWLEPLMPKESRIEQWRQLTRSSGLVFPALAHPKNWKDGFLLLSMVTAAVPVAALWWSLHVLGWLPGVLFWLFGGPAFVAWVVLVSRINQKLLNLTPRLSTQIPCRTVGELAVGIFALNEETFERAAENEGWDEEAVWKRIVAVVSQALGVRPQDISANTPVEEDLGEG
jgi:hypothetical protein